MAEKFPDLIGQLFGDLKNKSNRDMAKSPSTTPPKSAPSTGKPAHGQPPKK